MDATFNEVKPILEKILKAISEDRSKLTNAFADGGTPGGKITALRLEQAIGNHLFDDSPELFGITKNDAQVLRDYTQSTAFQHGHYKDYIEDMHEAFPQYMDQEDERYVSDINEERSKLGLPELQL